MTFKNNSYILSLFPGAAIVRMMSYSFGSAVMEQAIVAYLKEFSYKNADQDDLWTCIMDKLPQDNGSHPIDVKRVMDSWTQQAGYPLINFMRDYETGSAVVTQVYHLFIYTHIINAPNIEESCRKCFLFCQSPVVSLQFVMSKGVIHFRQLSQL